MAEVEPTVTDLSIAPEPPDSQLAATLVGRYFDELAARFARGAAEFDPALITVSAAEFTPPHGVFLVARSQERPVGCGGVHALDADTAEIKRMWVDPTARRLGIGRSLLAALERSAAQLGARTVRLDTTAYLTEVLPLYRSAGYGDIPAYNDNPYAAYWLEKPLR